MILSERQQTAQKLSRHIGQLFETFVVSPLPLAEGSRLRVQVFQCAKQRFLGEMQELGWPTYFVSIEPRMTEAGAVMVEVYEVDVTPASKEGGPSAPAVISDDRSPAEIRREELEEVVALLKQLGAKQ